MLGWFNTTPSQDYELLGLKTMHECERIARGDSNIVPLRPFLTKDIDHFIALHYLATKDCGIRTSNLIFEFLHCICSTGDWKKMYKGCILVLFHPKHIF